MATTLPLNTKAPVKHFYGQIRFRMNDGSYIEAQVAPAQRSLFIGVLNQCATLNPAAAFPTGLECVGVELDLGNGLDAAPRV